MQVLGFYIVLQPTVFKPVYIQRPQSPVLPRGSPFSLVVCSTDSFMYLMGLVQKQSLSRT